MQHHKYIETQFMEFLKTLIAKIRANLIVETMEYFWNVSINVKTTVNLIQIESYLNRDLFE